MKKGIAGREKTISWLRQLNAALKEKLVCDLVIKQ